MKARKKGTNEPFANVASVLLCSGGCILARDVEFEQEHNTSDYWQEQDSAMAFTLMRDIEQVSFISKEGKDERISWLNNLEDKFNNHLPSNTEKDLSNTIDHWQDVRERAAIAAMQGVMNFFGSIDYNRETIAEMAVKQADALVERLKGE